MRNRRIRYPPSHDSRPSCLAWVCLWIMSALLVGCIRPPANTGQHPYTYEQDDLKINYLLSLPEDYGKNPLRKWPLIVFLHGSGERGSSLRSSD